MYLCKTYVTWSWKTYLLDTSNRLRKFNRKSLQFLSFLHTSIKPSCCEVSHQKLLFIGDMDDYFTSIIINYVRLTNVPKGSLVTYKLLTKTAKLSFSSLLTNKMYRCAIKLCSKNFYYNQDVWNYLCLICHRPLKHARSKKNLKLKMQTI